MDLFIAPAAREQYASTWDMFLLLTTGVRRRTGLRVWGRTTQRTVTGPARERDVKRPARSINDSLSIIRSSFSAPRTSPKDSRFVQMSPPASWVVQCYVHATISACCVVVLRQKSGTEGSCLFAKPHSVHSRYCVVQDAPNQSTTSSPKPIHIRMLILLHDILYSMCVTISCLVVFLYSPVSLA